MLTGSGTATAATSHLQELEEACDQLAHTAPEDIQAMASLLQKMSLDYYQDVREQARSSFHWAVIAAAVGTGFFIIAVWPMREEGMTNAGLVAGAIVSLISGVNFWLYSKAARQFSLFHICLERANRFMLANSLCEHLNEPMKDDVRKELVRVIAHAPMLTPDLTRSAPVRAEVEGGVQPGHPRGDSDEQSIQRR